VNTTGRLVKYQAPFKIINYWYYINKVRHDLSTRIREYQQRCFKYYKKSIGLPDNYVHLHNNPVSAFILIETTANGVMIIGEYGFMR